MTFKTEISLEELIRLSSLNILKETHPDRFSRDEWLEYTELKRKLYQYKARNVNYQKRKSFFEHIYHTELR